MPGIMRLGYRDGRWHEESPGKSRKQ